MQLKKYSAPFKILIILIGITILGEVASRFLAIKTHNSMPVYHIISPIEYIFITSIYTHFFKEKTVKIILLFTVPLVIFSIVNSFYIQGIGKFPSNFILLAQCVYLIYSLLGFAQIFFTQTQISIYKQSFFWLNLAMLFFSTTLFLYFGLLNYANRHHLNLNPLFLFSYVVNLIYYVMLSIGIYTDKMFRSQEK
ncbi:MAG: hypothetical protein ACXVBA_19665 [Mucilaginibacter sp.]